MTGRSVSAEATRAPRSAGLRDAVRRTRVLRVLDACRDVPVVSVEAPGGYGKTTALRQWAEHDPRSVVWVTVRPQAPDATWLARELVDGLHAAGLLDEPVQLPSASDTPAWYLGLLPVVERAVASATAPFVLVVDEAGALHGPRWESLAASVAASLPPSCQLVLAARTQAPASLRRLRSDRRLVTIGPEVLALDAVEGSELVRLLGLPVDHDDLLALLEQTGGWPIALPLAASALESGRGPRRALVTTEALADYLRHEVLEALDADDARFLLRAAVLPELDEASCDAVSGTTGSLARLRRLAAATRLLAPLDRHGERFRMHPLLAAFLAEELRAAHPASWRDAHVAAAEVGERLGDLDVAVFHLRAVQADERLGEMVWQHSGLLLGSGRMPVLQRWLHGLDEHRLLRSSRLALAAAWVASQSGDMLRMEQMRAAARTAAERAEPDFLLEVGLLDATVGEDGLGEMRDACERYLAARPPEDPWQILAYLLAGVSRMLLGDAAGARELLERGLRRSRVLETPLMTAHLLTGLADLALLAGDVPAAVPAVHESRIIMEVNRLDFVATSAPIFTTSAHVFLLEGRLPEARKEAARALRMSAVMQPIAPWHAVQGRLALANVFLGLGDGARARELIAEAEAAHGPAAASPVLDDMCRRVSGHVESVAQAAPVGSTLTTAEVRVLQYLPTHLSFPEIASQLFVSRHTVKTQALSAYRKLGAHTRGEAITKARAIGLLPPV